MNTHSNSNNAFSCVYKFVFVLICIFYPFDACCKEKTLFREDFNTLEKWEHVGFVKIRKSSKYSIESIKNNLLKAESNASASALAYKKEFNAYEYPNVRWRWKVRNIYKNGDITTKNGDDCSLRLFFIFKDKNNVVRSGKKSLKLLFS